MTTLTAKRSMIILIDNGHGKETAGKCSPDGTLKEWAYTREIARRVWEELLHRGHEAILVCPAEQDMPLSKRVRFVNDIVKEEGKDNVLLVSIHCNAAGNGSQWMKASGWEAYTSPGRTKADRLAECFYKHAEKELAADFRVRVDRSDGDSDKEASFYILAKTRCPAILTENLFMDNQNDVRFLLSELGKVKLTWLHVKAIVDYINNI